MMQHSKAWTSWDVTTNRCERGFIVRPHVAHGASIGGGQRQVAKADAGNDRGTRGMGAGQARQGCSKRAGETGEARGATSGRQQSEGTVGWSDGKQQPGSRKKHRRKSQ